MDGDTGSRRSWSLAVAAVLVALALIGGVVWFQRRSTPEGDGSLLPADRIGTEAWMSKLVAGRHDALEMEIVGCMAESGFDYDPVLNDLAGYYPVLDPAMNDDEFVEAYGWGISTLRIAQVQVDLEFRAQLSEQRSTESAEWIARLGACIGLFNMGDRPPEDFAEKGRAASEVATGIVSSQEYLDVEADWSACIADSGYEYSTIAEAQNALFETATASFAVVGSEVSRADYLASDDYARVAEAEKEFARVSLACGVRPPFIGPPEALDEEWNRAMAEALGDE